MSDTFQAKRENSSMEAAFQILDLGGVAIAALQND